MEQLQSRLSKNILAVPGGQTSLQSWLGFLFGADRFLNGIFYSIKYVCAAHVCPLVHSSRMAHHLGISPGTGSDSGCLHCCQQ